MRIPNRITIRVGSRSDLEVIRHMNEALFAEEQAQGHDPLLDLAWPRSKRGTAHYRKILTDPKYRVFLATAGDQSIGYIGGSAENKYEYRIEPTGELQEMYIKPEYRRIGVGKKLVGNLYRWLNSLGIKRIYVCAYARNTGGISFYRSFGFRPIDTGMEFAGKR